MMTTNRTPRKEVKENTTVSELTSSIETREARPVTYDVSDSALSIPEDVVEKFRQEGYSLRWVNHMIRGQANRKNLATKMRKGYSFVKAKEVPEMVQTLHLGLGLADFDGESNIEVDDLILAKIQSELVERHREVIEGKTRSQDQAIRTENAGKKVIDNSESSIVGHRGSAKKPTFGENNA